MKKITKICVGILILLCWCAVLPVAEAQYRAGIQGTVTDSTGAAVEGATVSVVSLETGVTKEATTDSSGVYAVNALAPGNYRVTVEKQGFKKKILDQVTVVAEQMNSVNVALEVGAVSEQITVSAAEMPLLNTSTATLSGTVTEQQIQKLPSFGRDVFNLLQLAPGAFGDAARDAGGNSRNLPGTEIGGTGASDAIFKTENGGQVNANGARTNQNNYQIDGVGMTSVSWGGTAVITPNEDSVKEVKIVTNNYDAENGRFSGGQIQIISANGTNEYHGSLFIKVDRPGLNAFNKWGGPFGGKPQRNTARFNQIGGSAGGPIIKNKLFAFFSYETIRNSSTSTGTGWYETPQLLTMAPGSSIASKFTTFPGEGASFSSIADVSCASIGLVQGTNCNMIPGQGLDLGRPLTSAVGTADPSWQSNLNPGLGGDGTGSAANLDGTPDLMFINTISPSQSTEVQYHGRLDYNVTQRDLVAFSIYRVPVDNTFFNGPVRSANLWHHSSINEAETALWDHTFSPTFINEARINAAGWRWNEITSNSQEPWGLPNANIDNLGTANPQFLGAPGPSVFNQWTYGAKDVLTKVLNSHTIKFGGEFTRLLFVDEAPWAARPSYNFRNFWDFLNDAPYQENGTFDPTSGVPTAFRKDTRENIWAFFVQDDYKLRPNLTLNLGMRWEYFGPLSEKNGNLGVVRLGAGPALLTGLSVRKGGNLFGTSKNNWGPQIGFAWTPASLLHHQFHSNFVLRGGFGIGYNGLEEAITLNGRNNPPFVSSNSTLTGSQILYGVPSDIHSFNGYPSNPFGVTQFDANNIPVNSVIGVTGFPASLPTTYTYRYSLEGQYDLGHSWVATVGYQGSQSRHLTRQYNLNFLFSQQVPLNPHVNNVDFYADDANANFNALLMELHHHFASSFELDGQYRLSRSRDQGSNNFAVGEYQFIPSLAWGPSDYDVTHAFKLWGIWSPTIFRGANSWMEKVAGGWSLSGILNWHTGFPWTPIFNNINGHTTCDLIYIGGACAPGSTGNLRPASYAGGAGSSYNNDTFMKQGGNFPNGGPAYFTAPAFTPGPAFPNVGPLPGVPGVGRNSFRGPRYLDVDATLSKAFGLPKMRVIGENAKIEFRANFYNLFNNLNLSDVDPVVTDPFFGTARQALGGRTVELQARFSF